MLLLLGLCPGVEHRARFESLQDDFRGGREGDAQAIVLRTLVHGRLRPTDWLTLGAELLDARAVAEQSSTTIDITSVNTAELLQGYLELRAGWSGNARSLLRAGRITMDLGSRRLVARNLFRNTINGFTGIDARTQWGEGNELRAFWVLPVQRRPNDRDRVRDNEVKLDEESFDVQFAGLFAATALPWGGRIEGFALGLVEDDAPLRNRRRIRNRKLLTPGFRAYQAPSRGRFDYQLESVIQVGRSRLTTTSSRDLDHVAHFHHAELGYSFDAPLSSRVLAQFDYASGDRKPDDGKNQRFAPLFGARRFDFGPTGIYGPFVRTNLITPGARVQLRPLERVSSLVCFRSFWLASKKDGVPAMGLSDPNGNSGR